MFWADKPTELETGIVDAFGDPPKDDPDRDVRAVESLYKAIEHGLLESDEGTVKFFALGLAPNAAAYRYPLLAARDSGGDGRAHPAALRRPRY